eukprot:CAMPEP_0175930560 /NCGR_PEP_ID=MMETSP0108-20121206/18368_1 /TAXON_ID=195067 ORGANISM="Goniomonas pacifica, Strain CCMP1869" /NCGR_SAMPLE_ID=MMETSP0108 /ASSEMBLY_ACC=CAM_ASM_000204 /LENGTH=227 /DNA_ID=CAMNT_0017254033 /DNA_START=50 /DNA_END=733 /DNA_ORIENTATION=+
MSTHLVSLDVGGKMFTVAQRTLRKHPNSKLARLEASSLKPIFVDRCGKRFRYVLDFLRDDVVYLPPTETKEVILRELEYFELEFSPEQVLSSVQPFGLSMTQLHSALADYATRSAKCIQEAAAQRERADQFIVARQIVLSILRDPEAPEKLLRPNTPVFVEVNESNAELFQSACNLRSRAYDADKLQVLAAEVSKLTEPFGFTLSKIPALNGDQTFWITLVSKPQLS